MNNRLMPMFDKLILRKRAIIKSINDQLEKTSQGRTRKFNARGVRRLDTLHIILLNPVGSCSAALKLSILNDYWLGNPSIL
jgi:hypothetical protein